MAQSTNVAALQSRAAATAPAQPDPRSFAGMLDRMKPQLAAALPKHLNADRMVRIALTCYRMTPALAECDPKSVLAAVVQCAQLGLEPGLLGQAYLIPFKRNIKDGNTWRKVTECQFIPGYKGLLSLARRSGEVTAISTEIVYERDEFEMVLGVEPTVVHRPYLDGDRGAPKLVYGVAKFRDGGYHFEWMPISGVDAIRARSKSKDNGPWVTDYEQMARKTVIRRMANYLPMSVELASAIAVDDAVGSGQRATYDGEFVTVDTPAPEAAGDPDPAPEAVGHDPGEHLEQSVAEQREPEPAATPSPAPRRAARSAEQAGFSME